MPEINIYYYLCMCNINICKMKVRYSVYIELCKYTLLRNVALEDKQK